MAEILLFHHAQGLTAGCRDFADRLLAAGHVVHVPDLYEGKTFAVLTEGVAHAEAIGFETVIERGRRAAEHLPNEIVYAGFSLGVLPTNSASTARSSSSPMTALAGGLVGAARAARRDGVRNEHYAAFRSVRFDGRHCDRAGQ